MTTAALIEEIGAGAVPGTVDDPTPGDGEVLIDVGAVALNPVDLAISRGLFYAGHPPAPYVPGIEAVGVARNGTHAGRSVYASGGGRGVASNGLGAALIAFPEDMLIELPDGADPAVACALGTAGLAGWLPLSWRAPVRDGETVLVLGATGAAGSVAVQAARHLGAGRVIGAGRTQERLDAIADLADDTVALGEDPAAALADACADDPPTLIYDALWGAPAVAALGAAKNGARLVQVGASAGPAADVPSAFVRGKQTELLGYSNFVVPRDVLVAAYLTMVDLAGAGDLRHDVHRVPFAEAGAAWDGLARGDGKYVLVP